MNADCGAADFLSYSQGAEEEQALLASVLSAWAPLGGGGSLDGPGPACGLCPVGELSGPRVMCHSPQVPQLRLGGAEEQRQS